MTAAQLSDALAPLGVSLKRAVIANLESGVRRTISVAEVLALAYVLGVPPLLLLVPVGEAGEVEILPGVDAEPWDAARWITGEGAVPARRDRETDQLWRANVDLLRLYREHTARVADWRARTRIAVVADTEQERDRLFERALARRREIEDALRLIRRAIRDRGDQPPALPPELAPLDAEELTD